MTDYINKVDLLLALADLPNEAGKLEALRVVYDMPTRTNYTITGCGNHWLWGEAMDAALVKIGEDLLARAEDTVREAKASDLYWQVKHQQEAKE